MNLKGRYGISLCRLVLDGWCGKCGPGLFCQKVHGSRDKGTAVRDRICAWRVWLGPYHRQFNMVPLQQGDMMKT